MGFVSFDEDAATDVMRMLGAAKQEADGLARAALSLLAEAGPHVEQLAGTAPRELGNFAAWCAYSERSLRTRLGYLRRPDAQLFPTRRLFATPEEARRRGQADGAGMAADIAAYQRRELTITDLQQRLADANRWLADPVYATAFITQIDPKDLGRLAAQTVSYDADHDGVLNDTEAPPLRAQVGALFDALALSEAAGQLPCDYREEILALASVTLAGIVTLSTFATRFLVDVARNVFGPRPDEPLTDWVVLGRAQLMAEIAKDPQASRMVIADSRILNGALRLTTEAATIGRDATATADRSLAKLLRSGLALDAGTPAQRRAAWESLVRAGNAAPELFGPHDHPRLVNQAIVDALEPYLPALAFDGVKTEDRELYQMLDPGEPSLRLDRAELARFIGTLIADSTAREILTGSTARYVFGLHLVEQFRAGANDPFVRRTLLLASAVGFMSEAAELAWEDTEELNDLRLAVAESVAGVLLDLIDPPIVQSALASYDVGGILDQVRRTLTEAQPHDGGDTLSLVIDGILAVYRAEIFATNSSEAAAKEFDALRTVVLGNLFEKMHSLENAREQMENE